MKKFLAIAACALLAGCLEPETIKIDMPAPRPLPKAPSIFDNALDWTAVKSVKIFTLDEKRTEVDRIIESTANDIDRALNEGMLHWITDSVFVYETHDKLFIKEFKRDEPRFYEYPRRNFVFEFIRK